jgi:hypothetical protein
MSALYSAIPVLWMLKIVRWEDDDAINSDPLRMRRNNLTQVNLT